MLIMEIIKNLCVQIMILYTNQKSTPLNCMVFYLCKANTEIIYLVFAPG